jgi:hypothetical protein
MSFSKLFFRIRKGFFLLLPLGLIASYAVHQASGYSSGVIGASTQGCSCHGSKSTATIVKIYTSAPQIIAGQTYDFTISVANPSEKGAGCDISTSKGGTLSINATESNLLQLYGGELTHTQTNVFSAGSDSAVWNFQYTAPKTPGVAHIYAAGNAVNHNGQADAGDHWNTVVDNITVVSAAGVASNADVASNLSMYPNPSRGPVTLSSTGLSGEAQIEVSDLSGRVVHTGSAVLNGETALDLSSLPNGPYFVSIHTADGKAFTRRVIIAK